MKKKKITIKKKKTFLKENSPESFMIGLAVVVIFFAIIIIQAWI